MLFANGKEKNCFCKFYPHLLLFYEEESVAKQKLLAPVRLALSAQGLIMPINLNLLPDTLLSWSVETKHYSNCVACHLHHALVNFVLKGQVLARQWHVPEIPAPQEAKAGGPQVQDQPGQLSETLSQTRA